MSMGGKGAGRDINRVYSQHLVFLGFDNTERVFLPERFLRWGDVGSHLKPLGPGPEILRDFLQPSLATLIGLYVLV